jgi:hypothetical protein
MSWKVSFFDFVEWLSHWVQISCGWYSECSCITFVSYMSDIWFAWLLLYSCWYGCCLEWHMCFHISKIRIFGSPAISFFVTYGPTTSTHNAMFLLHVVAEFWCFGIMDFGCEIPFFFPLFLWWLLCYYMAQFLQSV